MITLQHFGRGLSWLRIPKSILERIDMQPRGYRFRSNKHVYLEDIADQFFLQDRLKEEGIPYRIESRHYSEIEQFIQKD